MELFEIADKFAFEGECKDVSPYGNGHINDTYAVTCDVAGENRRYILQRLNPYVFPDREGLMRNMIAVTDFLREKVVEDGGDPDRECLYLIPTIDGKRYFTSEDGDVWRATQFIEHTDAYLVADDEEMYADAGRAFGQFVARLGDFDASSLFEVIPNFHNTEKRLENFRLAVKEDKCGRLSSVRDEVEFVERRCGICGTVVGALRDGSLPVRVTHNDTKLNNVLIDVDTKKSVCVIDLDTVMAGSMLYDFGDGVRVGCSTAAEDEKDLGKVHFDINMYRAFERGFLKGMGNTVTPKEKSLMSAAARLMTFECGMRFLTDYLAGDVYFKTKYAEHNLVRARTQFKLVEEMEKAFHELEKSDYCFRNAEKENI